jgi:methylphosphotriester-DNA--protein-cysteine methyltransferase
MIPHGQLKRVTLGRLIRAGQLKLAGNARLRIYGLLTCRSGKRLKQENRVFFVDENEAIKEGYRPCGHCMPVQYREWKLKSAIQTM